MSTIGAGARGLILDDNEASRFLVGSWLRQAGFDVREASTGAQALEVLQQDTIDLAVLDVNLPDISGYEVCEAIRANPSTAWMPVIHVSATAIQAADRSEGLLRGADAFLVHPIERSDFVGVVTALSRRSSGRRTVTTTAVRLRELASSTADVHGASEEGTLFRAMVTGSVADRRDAGDARHADQPRLHRRHRTVRLPDDRQRRARRTAPACPGRGDHAGDRRPRRRRSSPHRGAVRR